MKKLKPTLSVLGSVTMALTLASPALAETTPEQDGKVETFKENKNMKEGQNIIYDGSEKRES